MGAAAQIAVAITADGQTLEAVEAELDVVLAEVIDKGVTDAELERAKNGYIADYIYESDNQATLARRYGWNLVVGRTLEQVDNWPDAIARVTPADVKAAAIAFLDVKRSVTGYLMPPVETGPRADAAASPMTR